MNRNLGNFLAPAACVGLLAAVALLDPLRVDYSAAEPFHARVREAAGHVPLEFGAWVGKEEVITRDALELLKPNASFSRVFRNVYTGRGAQLLFVQCKDARDLVGHYPKICYKSSGWSIDEGQPCEWPAAGMTIPGMEYRIVRAANSFGGAAGTANAANAPPNGGNTLSFIVRDFFILPDGSFSRDMESVTASAATFSRLAYGAAQVQVLFEATTPAHDQDAIFQSLLSEPGMLKLIHTLQDGIPADIKGRGTKALAMNASTPKPTKSEMKLETSGGTR